MLCTLALLLPTNQDWGESPGSHLSLNLDQFSGQTIRLRFRAYGRDSANYQGRHINDLQLYSTHDHDLCTTYVNGFIAPVQGFTYPYVTRVYNYSSQSIDQYTISLMTNYGEIISTLQGTPLEPGMFADYSFSWIPHIPQRTVLHTQVLTEGDIVADNNSSAPQKYLCSRIPHIMPPSAPVLIEIKHL